MFVSNTNKSCLIVLFSRLKKHKNGIRTIVVTTHQIGTYNTPNIEWTTKYEYVRILTITNT